MKHSESIKNIAPAIRNAQSKIKGAIKDAENPFFKSMYADLESCWDAVKDALQAEKLAVIQTMGFIPEAGPTLITTLLHDSGEYITGEQPVCAKADNPQDMGSAITYARRYGLSAIVGLIQVDDDAETAMKPVRQQRTQATTAPNKPLERVSTIKEPIPTDMSAKAHVMQVGKFKGRAIQSIDLKELKSWVNYMRKLPSLDGKGLEDVQLAEAHLRDLENPKR